MNKSLAVVLAIALLLPAAGWPAAGQGIGGVEVGIRKKPGRQTVRTASTDERGAFSLGDLEPGTYALILTVPGGQPLRPGESAKSYFESRSNTVRKARTQVLEFNGWPYSLSIGGAGVTGGAGTIALVEVSREARAMPQTPAARIELEIEIGGATKTSVSGSLRTLP